jgi:hypothetical protein
MTQGSNVLRDRISLWIRSSVLKPRARLAFPDGSVSARTLRAEAARGKLAIFRIGKKYYTTLAAIEKMVVEKCPVPPKVRIYLDARSSPSASQLSSGIQAILKELGKDAKSASLEPVALRPRIHAD